jgi:drug/metabolite transporter (DMT)-like permease
VQWIGIIVAIVGVTLASGPEISGAVSARPIVLSALAAVSFGSCLIFLAKGGAFSVTTTAIGMRIQSVAILLLVVVIAKSFSSTNPTDWLWLAVIGVFDIGANISLTVAAQTGYLSLVGMLGSLYPVVTVLLARFVLQERLKGIQYYGVAIALGGVVAIAAG